MQNSDSVDVSIESARPPSLHDVLRARQMKRVQLYKVEPAEAWTTDCAETSAEGADAADPMHTKVVVATGLGPHLPIGVHQNIGGWHDQPTPGDVLCAALASCADSTLRVVASKLGIQLESLAVRVKGEVDVRGTLGVGADVPVGFQRMRVDVRMRLAAGTSTHLERKLQLAAEHCCVVLQTLRSGVLVELTFQQERQR